MFQVFALRPWKRTYATGCVAAATGGDDVRRARPRRVDGDVGEPVALEERERVRPLVLLEPGAVPELDERDERIEQRADARELGFRLGRLHEPRVVLEQDPAELPGELERLERRAELGERRVVRLGRLVAGHRGVRLHVEHELGRRALRPAAGDRRIGEVVVGRVDLDRVEALRVVAEPSLRRRDAPRIPGLDEPLVGEAARPEANGRGHGGSVGGRTRRPPTTHRYFFLTTLLFAVKPFTVGLTHGTWPMSGCSCEQSGRRGPSRRDRVARKNVPAFALKANLPFAATVARAERLELGRHRAAEIVTDAPPRACPACVTAPVISVAPAPTSSPRESRRRVRSPPGDDGPATFGVPTPGLYGTQKEIHAPVATALNTPLIASSAL